MEKISIKTGAVNIFKPIHQNKESKHTNPFGISFKGNVLQADVFSSSKPQVKEEKTGITQRIADRGRAVKSAIVGGINNFNNELSSRFNNGINKIVSFGKKISENTKSFWKKANETFYILDFENLSNGFRKFSNIGTSPKESYTVKDLVQRPVSELETMFRSELGIEG